MSEERTIGLSGDDFTIPRGHGWAKIPLIAAVIGVIGLASSIGFGGADWKRFFHSYHVALIFFLSWAIGSLFFVLFHYVTRAGWSAAVRRIAESAMATLPLFALLFIPTVIGLEETFHWAEYETARTALAEHPDLAEQMTTAFMGDLTAAQVVEENHELVSALASDPRLAELAHDPEGLRTVVLGDELLDHKKSWLNGSFFSVRTFIYLAVWILIAWYFRRKSTQQDETKAHEITRRLQRASPVALIFLVLTFTAAAFDWLMSLDPHWFSTIFAVYFFAGCLVSAYAVISIVAIAMKRGGLAKQAIRIEHYHDLGKLLFAFTVFWAYIAFSQYMLIWYANVAEETIWYYHRWQGTWRYVTVALAVGHFVVPFFFLMSRHIKRRSQLLLIGAVWMLLMHLIDIYWLVMPAFHSHEGHAGASLALTDVTTVIGIGGLWVAVFVWQLRRHAVVPVGDPRLEESLTYENI